MKIKNFKALPLILLQGDIGIGKAYGLGYLEFESISDYIENYLRSGALKKGPFKKAWNLAQRWLKKNTLTQAKKNISAHYDLGNTFYQAWLDPSMTYSSALFLKEGESLEEAQKNKYQRVIRELELSTEHVLEIGCGWGGFIEELMTSTECTITAITLSEEQYRYAKERVAQGGWEDRVKLELKDYRLIEGSFDAVVSIEMIEALGYDYWDTFFIKLKSLMKPGAKCLIQAITLDLKDFKRYVARSDFMKTYIFPGGCLLELDYIKNKTGLKLINELEFTSSYIKTLEAWLKDYLKVKHSFVNEYGDFFLRIWQFYFEYCIAVFRCNRTQVWQFTFKKEEA